MKDIKVKIPSIMDMSKEKLDEMIRDNFEQSKLNPENMSFWLPKILSGMKNSTLRIPETKIIQLDFEWWKWLRSDSYSPEKIENFNQWLKEQLGSFREGEKLFLKTGIFSNKFMFKQTVVENRNNIGEQFLDIFYSSMMLSADNTSEVVVREFVENKEERSEIYEGMTLHTEFRVFYDFDKKEVIGVSNYWNPDIMSKHLQEEDIQNYNKERDIITSDYNQNKQTVVQEVANFMENVTEMKGSWSVDIMKNGSDYWLIDMARMERSALVRQMEKL